MFLLNRVTILFIPWNIKLWFDDIEKIQRYYFMLWMFEQEHTENEFSENVEKVLACDKKILKWKLVCS